MDEANTGPGYWDSAVKEILFEDGKPNPERVEQFAHRLFCQACTANEVSVVHEMLVTPGIHVDQSQEDHMGRTPLRLAAEYGRADIVDLILKHTDASLVASDNRGRTALIIATARGRKEVIQRLLEESIEEEHVNFRDIQGRTAFTLACTSTHEDIVLLLLSVPAVAARAFEFPSTDLSVITSVASAGLVRVMEQLMELDNFEENLRKENRILYHVVASGRHEMLALLFVEFPYLHHPPYCNADLMEFASQLGKQLCLDILQPSVKSAQL